MKSRDFAPLASWAVSTMLIVAAAGCQQTDDEYKPPPPPKVTVARPVVQTVTRFIEENGETEAVERAEVRARVRGFLETIEFTPAQTVQEGDVLYRIERAEYEAAVAAADAALGAADAAIAVAEAADRNAAVEVKRSELEFERQKALFEKDATTRSDFERATANRDAALAAKNASEANLTAARADRDKAQAQLDQAKLDLSYTEVVAPISGQITRTLVKKGNLVESGTHLATIVAPDPIYANFSISDRDALQIQSSRLNEDGELRDDEVELTDIPVYLRRESDSEFRFTGNLDYFDQEGVDQATGTLGLRAIFGNAKHLLLPGLFVRVRLPVGKITDAILIPEKAIIRDQTGKYVLIVDGEDNVERSLIQTGPQYGEMVVVEEGVDPSDRVILEGLQRARPGSPVTPTEITLSPVDMPSAETEPASDAASDDSGAPSGGADASAAAASNSDAS
ncbi:efflux RND transporter periplasmic adaptor subunit [Maioricimonas sp. JC845]|uniref:efflux RND transporter periplasmic adaptor subunit n=1 Tax=Maioricimonas sp. JC845 TaxID=3232138 RepID=UPI0034576770